jgi:hypothetical protein
LQRTGRAGYSPPVFVCGRRVILAINLCTRNRPQLVLSTVERTLANIRNRSTLFVVSVDDDDEPTIEALAHYMSKDVGVLIAIAPREDTLGEKYNRILKIEPQADVYLTMVDYAPHVTPGFDERILAAAKVFPDGIGVVYNWMANLSFPQINAVTRGLVERMGYIYPPYFPYWFVDHWLDDIAKQIDRIAFADVHIDVSKRPGTMEMREPELWATFFDLCVLERRAIADRIIDDPAFKDPAWRKKLLKRNHPMVEHHSLCINQMVRNEMANIGVVGEMPERYVRVREAAKLKAKDLVADVQKAAETETMPILAA